MINVIELDSGVRIVYEKMDQMETVSLGVFFKAGSVDEEEKDYGISHFVEHMMFKGTNKRSASQIADGFDSLGGSVNAYTARDHTCYYFKTTEDTLSEAMDILFDMLSESTFLETEMEKEKRVILEEIKMLEDQPDELAIEHCTRLVFKNDPLEHDIAGHSHSLENMDNKALKEYIRKEYVAKDTVVSVCGKFDIEEIKDIVLKKLSSLEKEKNKKDVPLSLYKPAKATVIKDIEQTNICLGTRFLTLDSEDYYGAIFYNNILGGSMSSRLFQHIREEKGLAYTVMSMPQIMMRSGALLIYAGTAHEKVDECINGIQSELLQIKNKGISSEELKKAKNQGKSSIVFGMERTQSRMMSMGRNLLLMDRIITQKDMVDKINKVTLEDVNRTASIYSEPDNFSYVAVSPKEGIF